MKITKFVRKSVISVSPDITLKKIEEMMKNRKIRHLLVIEKDKLFGIISDRDIKKYRSLFAETKISKRADEITLEFKAHQIMTRDPITVYEDSQASDAISLMLKEHISCLPVFNMDHKVTGIITSSDLLKWLMHLFEFME